MPRFFFGLRHRGTLVPDGDGLVLANLAAVRREALQGARAIMTEAIRTGEPANSRAFEITDEQGEVVRVLAFKDALRLS